MSTPETKSDFCVTNDMIKALEEDSQTMAAPTPPPQPTIHTRIAQTSSFSKIPVELRNVIYVDCLPYPNSLTFKYDSISKRTGRPIARIVGQSSQHLKPEGREPALSQTCSLIRAETVPMFYGNQQFEYGQGSRLQTAAAFLTWMKCANTFAAPIITHVRHLELKLSLKFTHECGRGSERSIKTRCARLTFTLVNGEYDVRIIIRYFDGSGCRCSQEELVEIMMPSYEENMAAIVAGFGSRALKAKQSEPDILFTA